MIAKFAKNTKIIKKIFIRNIMYFSLLYYHFYILKEILLKFYICL